MLTKKSRFILIYFRIGRFALPIALPLRCFHEIIEGYMDFLAPFRWLCAKIFGYLNLAEGAALIIKNFEPFNLVNVNVTSKDANSKTERIRVKIVTR